MTVRVLVVDDEPDVEALLRQQFRREIRQGLTPSTLHPRLRALGLGGNVNIGRRHWQEDHPARLRHQHAGHERPRSPAGRKDASPSLPVFMISAYGDPDTVATALGHGA
jgi:hypothetical protein